MGIDTVETVAEKAEKLNLEKHPDLPTRSYMDDPKIQWETTRPNFDAVDKLYLTERTRFHAAGSLEKLVENLVKTWEMESTHKINPEQWGTVDQERYKFGCNGGPPKDMNYNIKYGNYIMMMEDSPLFDVTKETKESANNLFKTAFQDGFAWELLDLLSGPPKVSFTWRHWAHWTGPYKGNPPTGELMELFGTAIVEVDDNLKIVDIQVFFDGNPMLAKLMRKRETNGETNGVTNGEQNGHRHPLCPFH